MVQEKGQLPQASALGVPFVTFQRTRDTRSGTLPILGSRKPVSTRTPLRKRLRGAEISPLALRVGLRCSCSRDFWPRCCGAMNSPRELDYPVVSVMW